MAQDPISDNPKAKAQMKRDKENHGSPAQELPAGVTQAQIAAWKTEYAAQGDVSLIEVVDKRTERVYRAVLKPASRDTWGLASQHYQRSDLQKAGAAILDNCVLACDPEINQIDRVYVNACMECFSIVEDLMCETRIKKL